MTIDIYKEFGFTVHGQPATKKNSAVMVARRATLLPSKAYRKYEKQFRAELRELKAKIGELPHYEGPVQLTALYYLESRAHYPDLNGLIQATQDIISDEYTMVLDKSTGKRKRQRSRRWILSDDRIIKSLDGTRIAGIDRERPRVEITREKLESDYRIELEERVGGSRERPRAIRAHEWTQGDVKQNMRQIEEILNDTRFQRVEQEPFESFLVIRGMSMAAYIQAACKEKSFRL